MGQLWSRVRGEAPAAEGAKGKKRPSDGPSPAAKAAKAAPVDEAVPDRETYEAEESVVLNQTNVDKNNNKYYRIQLLKAKQSGLYHCWTHWGRVGEPGQFKLEPGTSEDKALKLFTAKFRQKTGVAWTERTSYNWVP